ncbi:MAG: hypothetical protein M3O09_02555 [Acidobacteriota bacterium]|nr:hypothetical protein [Acidobacteriota bacterium]
MVRPSLVGDRKILHDVGFAIRARETLATSVHDADSGVHQGKCGKEQAAFCHYLLTDHLVIQHAHVVRFYGTVNRV